MGKKFAAQAWRGHRNHYLAIGQKLSKKEPQSRFIQAFEAALPSRGSSFAKKPLKSKAFL